MDGPTAVARARAAWAYSGLKQRELAEKADIHYDRLRRILNDADDVSRDDLYAIADATGVPYEFMEGGWPLSFDERIASLEEARRTLEARLLILEEEVAQRSAGKGRSSGDRTP